MENDSIDRNVKYFWHCPYKNCPEGIRKAKMYLEWLIEALEKEDGEDEN